MLPKKPTLESNPPTGSAGQPTPPASSEGQGVQPPSMGQTDLPEDIRTYIETAIEEGVNKAFQSQKDRRIPRLEDHVKDLDGRLASYEKYRSQGLAPEQAAREVKVDEFIAAQSQTEVPVVRSVPPQQAGSLQTVEASKVVLGLLQNAGIPANDPGVASVLRSGSVDQMTKMASQLIIDRATTPAPTPGAQPAPVGGQTIQTEVTAADLQRQYDERKKEIRPGDVAAFVALKQEFRSKGLANLF